MNSSAARKKRLFNLIYLGICFLFLSLAVTAVMNIQIPNYSTVRKQETLIAKDNEEKKGGEKSRDGLICLAIDCIILSFSLWLGPSVLTITGTRKALVIGAFGDVAYTAAFYFDDPKFMFPLCAINGLTHALLWTAQGTYLIENSTLKTISRDTNLFWLIICAAPIVGNVILFFLLEKTSKVDSHVRFFILHVLVGISVFAAVLFCFVQSPATDETTQKKENGKSQGFMEALVKSWKVFVHRDMLMLIPIIIFSGQQASYCNVIFMSGVGFTLNLATYTKQLVPLTGIFIGLGVIIGGLVQYSCKRKFKNEYERSIFLSIGICCYLVSFLLTILTLPDDSVFGDTINFGILFNSVPICLIASTLLGIGQMYTLSNATNLLAVVFRRESSQCSAIFNFLKFGASGLNYYYAQFLGLYAQVGILTAFGIVGMILFSIVDGRVVVKSKSEKEGDHGVKEKMLPEHTATMIMMSSNPAIQDLCT